MAKEEDPKDGDDQPKKDDQATQDGKKGDPPPAQEEAAAPPPAPKKSKLPLIMGILMGFFIILLMIVISVEAIIIARMHVSIHKLTELQAHAPQKSASTSAHSSKDSHEAQEEELDEEPESAKPVYTALEKLTVNLQPDNEGDHFLQMQITLVVRNDTVSAEIKQRSPEIRSQLILYLSAQQAKELHSPQGKQQLSEKIASIINQILAPQKSKALDAVRSLKHAAQDSPETAKILQSLSPSLPVKGILFDSFFIQ